MSDDEDLENSLNLQAKVITQRRTRVPDKPPFKICWLTIVASWEKVLGAHEPLSILQRSAQVYEYADLLHKAAKHQDDPLGEMKKVVGFVLSGYISCSRQKYAPHKSLLGETFELDRMAEFGWRLVSEQVSRHPHTYAQWVEAADWNIHDEYTIETKVRPLEFRGEGRANGKSTLTMLRSGNKYTWTKLPVMVNVRISGIVLEHIGKVTICNETTGHACKLTFHKCKMRTVTGEIKAKDGQTLEKLEGNWDSHLKTVGDEYLWQRNELDDGASSYYSFSRFACQLNEPDDSVAPTDSRRRNDVRYHEEGSLTAANEAKSRIKAKLAQSVSYTPIWFNTPKVRNEPHTWNNKYWICKRNQDWSDCPRLFDD